MSNTDKMSAVSLSTQLMTRTMMSTTPIPMMAKPSRVVTAAILRGGGPHRVSQPPHQAIDPIRALTR